jgi:dTMP kinase
MLPCVIIKDESSVNVNSVGMEFKKTPEKKKAYNTAESNKKCDNCPKKQNKPLENGNEKCNFKEEFKPAADFMNTSNFLKHSEFTKNFNISKDADTEKVFSGQDLLEILDKFGKYLQNEGSFSSENEDLPTLADNFLLKYSVDTMLKQYYAVNNRGLIINIEGVDGTGKNTQSVMLSHLLTSMGYENEVFHFPSYDKENPNFTGTLCNMMLEGKFGNINSVTPVSNTMFFVVDQIGQWHIKIKKAVEEGKIVILDRFYYSNLFHHMTKLTGLQSEEFKKWFDLTIKLSGLPYPDLTVYMSLSPEAAFARMEKRQNTDNTHKSDIHEENKEYLRNCIVRGLDIANTLHNELGNAFVIINGEQNPNHIHEDILEALINAITMQ